jgi:hypothetical protein
MTVAGTLRLLYKPVTIISGSSYSTGTVTVTSGSTTVTGAGGASFSSIHVGSCFKSTDGVYYKVDAVPGTTTLTLATAYGGSSLGGQTYALYPCLPDTSGDATVNNGAITVGTNPANITVLVGAMLPSNASVANVSTGNSDASLVPETGNTNMDTSGVEGAAFPFYALFKGLLKDWHDNGGPDISMPVFWKFIAVIAGWCFGTIVMMATRQVIFGLIGYAIGFSVPAFAMGGVLDAWVPIIYSITALCLAGLIWKWSSSSLG